MPEVAVAVDMLVEALLSKFAVHEEKNIHTSVDRTLILSEHLKYRTTCLPPEHYS